MIFVACSGFPVPVSRYWQEFPALEVSETELGIPGVGTIGRWLRESPEGFGFSVLAPKSIIESEFLWTPETQSAVKEIAGLSKKINSLAVVFAAPTDWKRTRPRKTALAEFAKSLPARGNNFVIDIPSWPTDDIREAVDGTSLIVAFDPLKSKPSKKDTKLSYMRLPGPAGHRSRYDEPSLERLAASCIDSKAKTVFCTFCNIDMYANAKRTLQLLKSKL